MGVFSGIGILIAMYLLLRNNKAAASIISQMGSSLNSSVKVLQGR